MAILPIRIVGDPVLHTPTQTVTASPDEIVRAVRDVVAGHAPLSPQSAGHVIAHVRDDDAGRRRAEAARRVAELSDREREVCVLMAQGESTAGPARRLHLSESTVKTHINNAFAKLDVRDRAQAVALAHRSGIARG